MAIVPAEEAKQASSGSSPILSSDVLTKQLAELELLHIKPRDRLSGKVRDFMSKNPDPSALRSIRLDQLHVSLFTAKKDLMETTAQASEDSAFMTHTRSMIAIIESQVHSLEPVAAENLLELRKTCAAWAREAAVLICACLDKALLRF